jgi:hypothetical protein
MRSLIRLGLIFALLGPSVLGAPKTRRYPAIKRAALTVETNQSKLEESQILIIKDSNDRPAYELWVGAISLDKRTTHSIELSLSTTGIYASDPEGKYEPNLLNPDYWGHGVGREVIRPDEVCGANRFNPVVGAHREFNFRRMRIVVKLDGVKLSPDFCSEKQCGTQSGGFASMRITVAVEPGASTRRRPPGYDELGWRYLELKHCD